jgi:hypothetical protein
MNDHYTCDLTSSQPSPAKPGPMPEEIGVRTPSQKLRKTGLRVPGKTRKERLAKRRARRKHEDVDGKEEVEPQARPSTLLPPKPRLLVDKLSHVKEDRHSKKFSRRQPAERTRLGKNKQRPRFKFDSTRGFPGEGPPPGREGKGNRSQLSYKLCSQTAEDCSSLRHYHPGKPRPAKAGAARRVKEAERKQKRYTVCKWGALCEEPTHYHPQRDGTVHRRTVSSWFSTTFTSSDDPTSVGDKATYVVADQELKHETESSDAPLGEDYPASEDPRPQPSARPSWSAGSGQMAAKVAKPALAPPAPQPARQPSLVCPPSPPRPFAPIPEPWEEEKTFGDLPLPQAASVQPSAPPLDLDETGPQPLILQEPEPEPAAEVEIALDAAAPECVALVVAQDPPPLALVSGLTLRVKQCPIFVNDHVGEATPTRNAGVTQRIVFGVCKALFGTYQTPQRNLCDNNAVTAPLHPARTTRTRNPLQWFSDMFAPSGGLDPEREGVEDPGGGSRLFNLFAREYSHYYVGEVYCDLVTAIVRSPDFAGQLVLTKSGEMNSRLPDFCQRTALRILGEDYQHFNRAPVTYMNTINFCVNRLFFLKRIGHLSRAGVYVKDPLNAQGPSSKACLRKGA